MEVAGPNPVSPVKPRTETDRLMPRITRSSIAIALLFCLGLIATTATASATGRPAYSGTYRHRKHHRSKHERRHRPAHRHHTRRHKRRTQTVLTAGTAASKHSPATTTTTPTPTSPQPSGISGNWTMVMDSEFNRASLNTNIWTPGWFGSAVTDPVNTAEDDCYNSNNVVATGSMLDLNVTDQSSTCNGKSYPYTGSLISTQPNGSNTGFLYTYGVVEARVYIPAASNDTIANWPGVWADTTPSETYGEDDIVEGLAGQACYHYHTNTEAPGGCVTTITPGWHTFASDWQPGTITYYYDGTKVGSEASTTSQPMYIILDNTISASNLSLAGPSTMQVQYVRVWQ